MNERIVELADQAGADIWDTEAVATCYFDIQKYTELVVRECVGILESRNDHTVIVNAIKEVKEHFGVE